MPMAPRSTSSGCSVGSSGRSRALIVATYREDALAGAHPLRIVLGELARASDVERLGVEPLSPVAVGALAEAHELDPDELFRKTAGNPFFVTEVLGAEADEIPHTVRDAVLARAARLSAPARRLLATVAALPPRADLWLLERVAGDVVDDLEECLTSGLLAWGRPGSRFATSSRAWRSWSHWGRAGGSPCIERL